MTTAPLTLTRFDHIQAVLKHPDFAQALYDAGEQVMADSLITLHGAAHKKRRVMEFGVFTRGFFREYEQTIFPAALAPVLERHGQLEVVDLVTFGYEVTMNLTADFAGIDRPQNDSEETAALLSLVKKFSEGATVVHSTRDHDLVKQEVAAALAVFDSRFLQPSIQRRLELVQAVERGDGAAADLPHDVLTTLLKNRERLPLADDVLQREIAFYLQAGAHSTANAMIRVLHEVFAWRDANPELWTEHGPDPVFLQRCVHESLRLYPASPVAQRRSLRAVAFDGFAIAAQELVVLDLMAANRDITVYG